MTHPTNRQMLEALRKARDVIWTDRVALADCHTGPEGLDEDGAAGVADYDEALAQIDAAIASAEQAQTTDEVFRNECAGKAA